MEIQTNTHTATHTRNFFPYFVSSLESAAKEKLLYDSTYFCLLYRATTKDFKHRSNEPLALWTRIDRFMENVRRWESSHEIYPQAHPDTLSMAKEELFIQNGW